MSKSEKVLKHKVLLRRSAKKDLDKLNANAYRRILKALRKLENDYHPRGSKKIHSKKEVYRIRVGTSRILYQVVPEENTVIICRIVHRKEAYR